MFTSAVGAERGQIIRMTFSVSQRSPAVSSDVGVGFLFGGTSLNINPAMLISINMAAAVNREPNKTLISGTVRGGEGWPGGGGQSIAGFLRTRK